MSTKCYICPCHNRDSIYIQIHITLLMACDSHVLKINVCKMTAIYIYGTGKIDLLTLTTRHINLGTKKSKCIII